jgi:hypothetical protein
MTISLRDVVNSYWSSTDMNPTTTALSLLTLDLEVRSAGSPGRYLLQRLEDHSINLLGATRPAEFAQLLQRADPNNRHVLERLLEWTAVDNELLLVALVALSPELDYLAGRLSAGRPSDDAVSEVLTQATVAMRWTHELAEGKRVAFVLSYAFSKTRSKQRRMARHNVPNCPLPREFDAAETESPTPLPTADWLIRAVDERAITHDECRLIEATRSGRVSLQEFADSTGDSYDAARMRRSRAEDRLRRYLNVTVDVR